MWRTERHRGPAGVPGQRSRVLNRDEPAREPSALPPGFGVRRSSGAFPRAAGFPKAAEDRRSPGRCRALPGRVWLLLPLLGFLAAGCATVSLPPVNLKNPGWTVRQGQAVWHRQRGGEGIAGEILVATRSNGRALVQFSKNPFPLVVAQCTARAWTADFPPENKRYSGRGAPPPRIIFLQLPRALSGRPLPKDWSWRKLNNGGWRLENDSSGESLDGYFNP